MEAEPIVPRSEQPRFGLLLLTTFVSLGVQGTMGPGDVQQVLVTALAAAALLLALRSAEVSPRLLNVARVLAVAMLAASVFRVTAGGIGEGAARVMYATLVVFAPPAVVIGIVRELRLSHRVRLDAVMGVLSLYMLLGMLFGFAYGAIDELGGDPFFAGGQPATLANCLYFSFTTLTTTGYGDFAARSDLGHTLSVFEALIGQIYLVTVVSLIVSNLGQPARRARDA